MKKGLKYILVFSVGFALALTSVSAYERWRGYHLRDSSVESISEIRVSVLDLKDKIAQLELDKKAGEDRNTDLSTELNDLIDKLAKTELALQEEKDAFNDMSDKYEFYYNAYHNHENEKKALENELDEAVKDFTEVDELLKELKEEIKK